MAFNCADTRQRAYNRIDTSNPGGNWIDEKAYNRIGGERDYKGGSKRTLVGNWQEEQALEGDMLATGYELATLRKPEDGRRFQGGFESSAYLLSATDANHRVGEFATTQRSDYSAAHGDVARLRQAPLGARSEVVMQQVLAAAIEETEARRAARAQEPLSTTYRETLGGDKGPRRVVPAVPDRSYLAEQPVTLYTGNPVTGSTMAVQGKTPAMSVTGNPLARNTQFSLSKYSL